MLDSNTVNPLRDTPEPWPMGVVAAAPVVKIDLVARTFGIRQRERALDVRPEGELAPTGQPSGGGPAGADATRRVGSPAGWCRLRQVTLESGPGGWVA